MKRRLNSIYHTAGAAIIVIGFLLAARAAGLADHGGDFNEMVRTVTCGAAAMVIGAFLRWWQV